MEYGRYQVCFVSLIFFIHFELPAKQKNKQTKKDSLLVKWLTNQIQSFEPP